MSTKPPAPSADEKTVRIFHTGKGNGPMSTAGGDLLPGGWIDVPASLAEKLCRAYKHVKLAKDVIPGGAADPRVAAENAMLKAEVAKLTGQLAEINENGPKAIKAAQDAQAEAEKKLAEAAPAADVAELHGALGEFLAADSKKALEALQEKHADILPKVPEPTA